MKKVDNQKIQIQSEFIRLDQLLKWAGFAESGSEAKFLIDAGKAKVNEEVEMRRGRKIYPGDRVQLSVDPLVVLDIVREGNSNE